MKIVSEAEVKGKKVLVRCDFDVPLKNGTVADEERIERSLKTIKCLVKKEAKVILLSHLGRPEGKVVAGLRLDPVAKSLSKKLDGAVIKLDECLGNSVKETVAEMEKGDIVLLENLRFYKEEEKNDPEFAKKSKYSTVVAPPMFVVVFAKESMFNLFLDKSFIRYFKAV